VLKKYIIIFCVLTIAISNAAAVLAAPVTITIDASIEHQTIEGLGGQMESHYEYENDTQFWDILFKDVGVSAVRLGAAMGTDLSLPIFDEEAWPVYRIAKTYGLTLFPGFVHAKPEWKSPQVINGGTLLPQYYDTYSYFMRDAITYTENATGVTVTMNSPFPEPSLGYNGDPNSPYYHTYMTAADYRDFLKVYGPIIKSSKPNVKIYVPLDWNVDSSINYANVILSDFQARQWVDGLATNGYGWSSGLTSAQNWQRFANLAAQYNINEIWVPEQGHCTTCGNPPADPAGLITAQWIHEALAIGNANIWQQWLLIDKGQYSGVGMVGFVYSKYWPCKNGVCEYSSNGITKEGYSFKQFAHWVRPGAIRIDATSPDPDILVSSYKHPTDNTFTIVAINKGSTVKTVNIYINNYGALSNLFAYRTSLTENTDYLGQISLSNNSFSYDLPNGSITTFAVVSDTPTVPPPPPLPPAPPPPSSPLSSVVKVGYNWQWLIITLVSLALAGGYLLRKKMIKTRQRSEHK
jgi:O-glycosyl hydrolase